MSSLLELARRVAALENAGGEVLRSNNAFLGPGGVEEPPAGMTKAEIEAAVWALLKIENIAGLKEITGTVTVIQTTMSIAKPFLVTASSRFALAAALQYVPENSAELPETANNIQFSELVVEEIRQVAGNVTLSGFFTAGGGVEGGREGQVKILLNGTAANTIAILNESALSKSGSRAHNRGGGTVTLQPKESASYVWAGGASRPERRWVQL